MARGTFVLKYRTHNQSRCRQHWRLTAARRLDPWLSSTLLYMTKNKLAEYTVDRREIVEVEAEMKMPRRNRMEKRELKLSGEVEKVVKRFRDPVFAALSSLESDIASSPNISPS